MTAPAGFRVCAFLPVYNEADIIDWCLRHAIGQGLDVYLLENWSTDGTRELLQKWDGLVRIVDFPEEGPNDTFDWAAMLKVFERLQCELDYSWFVLLGADQVIETPGHKNLLDALWAIDQQGYNQAGFQMYNHYPVDDNFEAGQDPYSYFKEYELEVEGYQKVWDAWKKQPQVELICGGHFTSFRGEKPCPERLIKHHYSIRGQRHGEKKVFQERLARYREDELAKGWHIHYRQMQPGFQFVRGSDGQK